MTRRSMVVMVVIAMAAAACGGGDGDSAGPESAIAKSAIVDEMVSDGIPRATAECITDKMLDEFGIDGLQALGESEEPSPEVALRTLELLGECGFDLTDTGSGLGDNGFDAGEMPSDFTELAMPRGSVDGPYTYGDDGDLDGMWDACEAGSGEACDDLFFQSPLGSEYEAFGNTCGNRMELNLICSSLDE
ncbi:hypothetical protein HQ535_11385 [bacterium]|nr:hypothetical protein [bacterium]